LRIETDFSIQEFVDAPYCSTDRCCLLLPVCPFLPSA
jgi:hypothetical protein